MLVLGSKKCNECGVEDSLKLELREGGFWYRCTVCGFQEYVWSISDEYRKLQSILDRFNLRLEKLPPCLKKIFYKAVERV